MTNLVKMNQLVGANEDKNGIQQWAYMNRVLLDELSEEPEFAEMKRSVETFLKNNDLPTPYDEWDKFLDAEYMGGGDTSKHDLMAKMGEIAYGGGAEDGSSKDE